MSFLFTLYHCRFVKVEGCSSKNISNINKYFLSLAFSDRAVHVKFLQTYSKYFSITNFYWISRHPSHYAPDYHHILFVNWSWGSKMFFRYFLSCRIMQSECGLCSFEPNSFRCWKMSLLSNHPVFMFHLIRGFLLAY